ncbi:MAG: MATE family efflux transporter [Saprospiraceae bacterium]|jgi:putative MATE family efflux protein|nr:MATE family efflux transporter [Saprospiraceae bacterium]MBL0026174.1 MATE family efflux transporter [Saprospiraceae bacterium]
MGSGSASLKVDTSVKGIVLLTLPISMAKLIPELNYLFNAAFLGHLGSKELALAGITGVYYLIFSAIGYGLNNALLAIMSRRAGEDNRDEIFSTLWHGMIVAIIMSFLFILFTRTLVHPVMLWAGIEAGGARIAGDFLNIRIFGLLFLYSLQMQNAFLISIQQTRYLVLIAVVQSGVNLFLDYGLIFGHFGLPAMGFNGAAIASVISEFIGMITVSSIIYGLNISERFNIKPVFNVVSKTLKLVFFQGFPLMSQLAISTASWWIFFILVSRTYSYEEQAVTQTMRNLFGLGGVFSWAFGSSANTILSNLIGQGRHSELFRIVKKLCIISTVGMGISMILLNIFPSIFLGLFGQEGHFILSGVGPLRVVSVAMIILCVGAIWLNAVVATGQTKIVFWIEFWGITAYLIYVWVVIEVLKLSLSVAWMSEWVYWTLLFCLSYSYLKFGKWKKELSYTA